MKEVDEREDVLLGNEEGGKSNDYDNTVLCSTDQKYFKYVSDDENQVNNIIVGDDEPVKKKVDDKTQITVNQYEDFVGQFASLSDEFASLGQQNMVIQFSPFLNYKTNKNYVNKTIIYNPSLEANIYQVNVIDKSSEEAKSMINSYNNIKKNIEDGEAKYPKDEYPTHNRILEFEKKHAEFLADPDAADLLMGCPEYNLSFKKTMTNLPDAKFEDPERNHEYLQNLYKWNEFHNNHVFLDQAEENQNFFLNVYVPYAKKMKAGTVTPVDSMNYNVAYAEHMTKQKMYFEEIKNYNLDDPDFALSSVNENKDSFKNVWQGASFGDVMLYNANTSLDLLDKGWPAADMNFLLQLKFVKDKIDRIASNKNKTYNADEVKTAKDIQKKMKAAYNDIMDNELLSPEDRVDKIREIEAHIKAYAQLSKNINTRLFANNSTKIGDDSILWLLEEAKIRKVHQVEIGKDAQHLQDAKSSFQNLIGGIVYEFQIAVPANERTPEEQELMDDFQTYADSKVVDEALTYVGMGTRQLYQPIGDAVQLQKIKDENAYGKLKNTLKDLSKSCEKIPAGFGDDEIGMEMKEFANAKLSNKLNRAINGYGNNFLVAVTPFGDGIKAIEPQLPVDNENNKLRNNYKKWENRFPIHRLYVEGQRQLDTFAEYYAEKEAGKGVLSKEREEYFRQRIYDETVNISLLYNKVMATIEDPVLYGELQNDGVTQDDPSVIHPLTRRGAITLNCALEGYKTALENGWTLEDAALLSTFYQTIYTQEKAANYTNEAELRNVKKKEKPDYGSPEKMNYLQRMKKTYEDIKNHPLKSPADRMKYLEKIDALMKEGEEKKYLFFKTPDNVTQRQPILRYYNELKASITVLN